MVGVDSREGPLPPAGTLSQCRATAGALSFIIEHAEGTHALQSGGIHSQLNKLGYPFFFFVREKCLYILKCQLCHAASSKLLGSWRRRLGRGLPCEAATAQGRGVRATLTQARDMLVRKALIITHTGHSPQLRHTVPPHPQLRRTPPGHPNEFVTLPPPPASSQ